MKRLILALAAATVATAASAQIVPSQPTPPPKLAPSPSQTGAAGSAGVKARLEALGYKDVHDLRRGPDGEWRGRATRNNGEISVTTDPAGNVTTR